MNEQSLFNLADLAGTFAFAISGATAARVDRAAGEIHVSAALVGAALAVLGE